MKTYAPKETVDFLIIGSGAAGGIMARELARAGFSVVVLEQGPHLKEADFLHDEIKFFHQRFMLNDPAQQPNTFRKTEADRAVAQPVVMYGKQVGGGTVHYTGNHWRFHEGDFEERTRHGSIAGASLEDWPIRYAELEPYYAMVERELGVSGAVGPHDPPRSGPYPLPPLPVKSSGVIFERAARQLGWHPFPAPMAILSQPYRGRGACTHCGFCKGFGCEVRAKSSTLASVIPEAIRTGRCEIRPSSYVRRIQSSGDRVTGAVYFDARRREVMQRAKAVVVCANGAETPRLLLMSASNAYPRGLANGSGLVGRNLMFDCGTASFGLFEKRLNDYKSVAVSRVVHDFYDTDPKRGFWGGGGLDARFEDYPIGFALWGLPPDVPKWGAGFKRAMAEYYTRTMCVLTHATCLPRESNSISLDPELKDAWGLPAIRVTFQNHPDDLQVMRFLAARARQLLETAEAKKIWAQEVGEVTESVHLMGTCRMGRDAQRSVVDAGHKAHDVANLFVVDGSSFVTCGRNQPTATIQALAFRAAELVGRWARG